MKRREFLTATAGAAAGLLTGCDACNRRPPLRSSISSKASAQTQTASVADLELSLRAGPDRATIMDGAPTDIWRFSAQMQRGSSDAVVPSGDGYLGPTLKVRRGQRVRVHLENALDEETIVHWHGLYLSEHNDGLPSQAIGPGQQYEYDFEVHNRAGTYWYHPHPADRTGPQVYYGLAGLLLVSDDDERRVGLPDGDRDLPIVLQDRTFDDENRLVYEPNPMIGFLGEQVLINGRPSRVQEVARGPHRLRILNASNSRIYDLAWSDGSPLVVIGTDGGLLDASRAREHVLLGPGQRLELWASFGDKPSDDVWLVSRRFSGLSPMMGMGMGMGRGRMMGRGMMQGRAPQVPSGAPLRLQRFVATGAGAPGRPPARLVPAPGPDISRVVNAANPRTFTAGMRMMRWLLNGRTYQMGKVAENERVRLGTVEEWEFHNLGGPMAMAHPIHLHGAQFQIVERQHGRGLRSLREGLFDEGWLDTFLLLPGDRVRLRVSFDRYAGMFLYHCHNLEHEDMGMMRNYFVEAA